MLFLLMPMGNQVILFSWWIYCSINSLASAELLLLIYTVVGGESNLEFTAEDLYRIKHSERTGKEGPCVKISGHSLSIDHLLSCFEYSVNDHL